MKRSGQRQDVAFLALAVAVLAIAVALFVGIRTLSNRGKAKPAAPPAAAAVARAPKPAKPPGSAKHDPFSGKAAANPAGPVGGPNAPNAVKAPRKPASEEMRLVGIVQGQGGGLLATVRRGNHRYYAKRGDQVAGYTVAEIEKDRLTLAKGTERLTLRLHEPKED